MTNEPEEKITTLDDLAGMVQRGFAEMTTNFEKMGKRFDHIENILLAKQDQRIEKLEHAVQELRDALAM